MKQLFASHHHQKYNVLTEFNIKYILYLSNLSAKCLEFETKDVLIVTISQNE